MRKKYTYVFLAIMLVLGLTFAVLTASPASDSGKPSYKVNDNGETYGSVDLNVHPSLQEYPDLVAAIGIGGVRGYVRQSEAEREQPKTPEEAAIYMERLEAEIAQARAEGREYLRYIPLYESDGVTVIGQFGIEWLGTDEPLYENGAK